MKARVFIVFVEPNQGQSYYVIARQEKGWMGWGPIFYAVNSSMKGYTSTTNIVDPSLHKFYTFEEAKDAIGEFKTKVVYTKEMDT